jgi:hypothetical protein
MKTVVGAWAALLMGAERRWLMGVGSVWCGSGTGIGIGTGIGPGTFFSSGVVVRSVPSAPTGDVDVDCGSGSGCGCGTLCCLGPVMVFVLGAGIAGTLVPTRGSALVCSTLLYSTLPCLPSILISHSSTNRV